MPENRHHDNREKWWGIAGVLLGLAGLCSMIWGANAVHQPVVQEYSTLVFAAVMLGYLAVLVGGGLMIIFRPRETTARKR